MNSYPSAGPATSAKVFIGRLERMSQMLAYYDGEPLVFAAVRDTLLHVALFNDNRHFHVRKSASGPKEFSEVGKSLGVSYGPC